MSTPAIAPAVAARHMPAERLFHPVQLGRYGLPHRMVMAPLNLSHVVFTHLHSDHVTGFMDVLWAGWIQRRWQTPPVVGGPPGTQEFIDGIMAAMAYDIRIREGEILSREQLVPRVEEVEEGYKLEAADWQLEAFRVDHMPVAARANASHLILSHIIIRSRGDPAEFERDITPDYGGKLTVGEDLTSPLRFNLRLRGREPAQNG